MVVDAQKQVFSLERHAVMGKEKENGANEKKSNDISAVMVKTDGTGCTYFPLAWRVRYMVGDYM
jgi:hypothetical protein